MLSALITEPIAGSSADFRALSVRLEHAIRIPTLATLVPPTVREGVSRRPGGLIGCQWK